MTDKEFLIWLRDRLVNQYKESPNTDFVARLERIIHKYQQAEDFDATLAKQVRCGWCGNELFILIPDKDLIRCTACQHATDWYEAHTIWEKHYGDT